MKIWQRQPKPDSNTLVNGVITFRSMSVHTGKFSSDRSTRYMRIFQKVGGILIFNFVLYINKRHCTKSLYNTKGKRYCFLRGKEYALNNKFKFSKDIWAYYWKRIWGLHEQEIQICSCIAKWTRKKLRGSILITERRMQ